MDLTTKNMIKDIPKTLPFLGDIVESVNGNTIIHQSGREFTPEKQINVEVGDEVTRIIFGKNPNGSIHVSLTYTDKHGNPRPPVIVKEYKYLKKVRKDKLKRLDVLWYEVDS